MFKFNFFNVVYFESFVGMGFLKWELFMYKFCRLIKLLIVGGMVFVKVVFFLMLSFISFVMV